MRNRNSLVILAAGMALAGCTTMEAQIKSSGEMGQIDSQYVNTAEQLVQLDDQAGKLAASKASDARVVDVATYIMTQADTLNPALTAAMHVEGIQPPAGLPPQTAAEVQKLSTLSGPAFDREYVADELALHQQALKVFQQEDATTKDGALRAQVENELPALQDDLAKLQALSGEYNGTAPQSNS